MTHRVWVCGCVGVWVCGCVGVWVWVGVGPPAHIFWRMASRLSMTTPLVRDAPHWIMAWGSRSIHIPATLSRNQASVSM